MQTTAPVSTPVPQVLSSSLSQVTRRDADPKAVGKAFESMFATMMLKQMRESLEGGLFPGDTGDVLGGLFDHYMGEHIAGNGGFGVGDMIRHQLERLPGRTSIT
jgi:peptidoglycan hydrolase FlgJ